MAAKNYTLKDITFYFLKLDAWGFYGPVALVGYMHRYLVEQNNGLLKKSTKEG